MAKVPGKPKNEPISPRILYIAAGVVWGLVLAPEAGLVVMKFLAGLDWPAVAGTDYWPLWADWIVVASGAAAGLATFLAALIFGRNFGDRMEFSPLGRLHFRRATPWALLVLGVAVGAMTVRSIDDQRHFFEAQKRAGLRLAEFSREVHRFEDISVEWLDNGEQGRVFLSFQGERKGKYRLAWEVRDVADDGKATLLMRGETGAALGPGEQNAELPLKTPELVSALRRGIGDDDADITVSRELTVRARLIPELTRKEIARLPQQEPGNLAGGNSILIDETFGRFRVNFTLRDDEVVWFRE